MPDPIPLPQGVQGQDMREALDRALLAAVTAGQSEGALPSSPSPGQLAEDPTTGAFTRYNATATQRIGLWNAGAGPWSFLVYDEGDLVDADLTIWTTAEPSPGAGEVVVWVGRATWFELLPTDAPHTVTLPDMGGATSSRPLGFMNSGTEPITFQEQQFPSSPGDDFKNGEPIDLQLDPGEWVVFVGTAGVDGFCQILAEKRGRARTITNADSPYAMKWWELNKPILVDATSGAVTVSLSDPALARPGDEALVKKIDASGNAVTVDSVSGNIDGAATQSLSSQWDALRARGDLTDWFTF